MKTSEFRKYLEENWKFEETEDCFKIHGLVVVNKRSNRLEFLTLMYLDSLNTITLVKKIIEYACTPILEREEEKKYRLLTPQAFSNLQRGLVYSENFREFFVAIVGTEPQSIKSKFTQKEIDAMPFDTKFFIKEEV